MDDKFDAPVVLAARDVTAALSGLRLIGDVVSASELQHFSSQH
ncbi:MAG: hypothetical protein WCG85_20515 [Polyangia bacterium]